MALKSGANKTPNQTTSPLITMMFLGGFFMRDDQKERLQKCFDKAIDKVAEAIEESDKHSFGDKDGRGTLAWLGKGAGQFLNVAIKLEEMIKIGDGVLPNNQRGKSLEQQADETIARAEKAVNERRQQIGQKYS